MMFVVSDLATLDALLWLDPLPPELRGRPGARHVFMRARCIGSHVVVDSALAPAGRLTLPLALGELIPDDSGIDEPAAVGAPETAPPAPPGVEAFDLLLAAMND